MTFAKPGHPLLLAAAIALAACTQVTETLQTADNKIREIAGAEPRQASQPNTGESSAVQPASAHADAEVAQAVRLMDGDGVARDPDRAVELLRPHAEAGHARAQFLLGLAYSSGQGVSKDLATAASWFRRAGEQDQADAQYLLGLAHLRGDGVDKDIDEAGRWFVRSARNGNAGGQYQLALAYSRGHGITKDLDAAAQWFERAAEQGHGEAQYKTGEAYQLGRGVTKNRAWATRWFTKAAMQGVTRGQYMTGLAYAAGAGVPRDLGSSYQWLAVAADQGHDKAGEFRDRIGERLTGDQRVKAQAKAKSWQAVSATDVATDNDRPSVRFAQHTLTQLGFNAGIADGIYGPKTSGAVKAYETAKGLPVTGQIDRELLQRLKDDPIHAS